MVSKLLQEESTVKTSKVHKLMFSQQVDRHKWKMYLM